MMEIEQMEMDVMKIVKKKQDFNVQELLLFVCLNVEMGELLEMKTVMMITSQMLTDAILTVQVV